MKRRHVIARAVAIRSRMGPRITVMVASLRPKERATRVRIRGRMEAKAGAAPAPL